MAVGEPAARDGQIDLRKDGDVGDPAVRRLVSKTVFDAELQVARPGLIVAEAVEVERGDDGQLQILGRAVIDVEPALPRDLARQRRSGNEDAILPMTCVGGLRIIGHIGRTGDGARGHADRRKADDRRQAGSPPPAQVQAAFATDRAGREKRMTPSFSRPKRKAIRSSA